MQFQHNYLSMRVYTSAVWAVLPPVPCTSVMTRFIYNWSDCIAVSRVGIINIRRSRLIKPSKNLSWPLVGGKPCARDISYAQVIYYTRSVVNRNRKCVWVHTSRAYRVGIRRACVRAHTDRPRCIIYRTTKRYPRAR